MPCSILYSKAKLHFLLLHSSLLWWKEHLLGVSILGLVGLEGLHRYLSVNVLPFQASIEKRYLSLTILLHYLKLDNITDFSLNHRVPIAVNHTLFQLFTFIFIFPEPAQCLTYTWVIINACGLNKSINVLGKDIEARPTLLSVSKFNLPIWNYTY